MIRLRIPILTALAVVALAVAAAAERGSDGELRMLYWQAPSILNPYLSGGTKDTHAASLILEPLARYDENGDMVAWLAVEIPTLDNGGVASDLKSITWKLRDDVVWSDGTPFPDGPPRFVRLMLYRYRFTTPAGEAGGDWWTRELTGYLTEPSSRR